MGCPLDYLFIPAGMYAGVPVILSPVHLLVRLLECPLVYLVECPLVYLTDARWSARDQCLGCPNGIPIRNPFPFLPASPRDTLLPLQQCPDYLPKEQFTTLE